MKSMGQLGIWIGAVLVCILFSGCSSNTEIQVQQPVTTERAEKEDVSYEGQEDFMAFEERTLPDWNYEKGVYPTTFMVTFSQMFESEEEQAWSKINASPMCEDTAKIQKSCTSHFLEIPSENINPAYLEWCAEPKHNIPSVLENPGKIRVDCLYTTDDAQENVLYETRSLKKNADSFFGNLRVNIADGTTVNIATAIDDLEHPEITRYEETAITIDRITTEAEWMYDSPGAMMYLKVTREDFEKLVPKMWIGEEYYVKSVKGSENEMREYAKSVGGYVLEGGYFE